jgi:MFS family permease
VPLTRTRAPWLLILATGTMVMTLSALQTLVVPVLGQMAEQLGEPLNRVGWVLTANLLAAAVATPLIGRLGDAHGKRRVILCVLVVVAIGSLLAAITTSLPVLIAARVLQATSYGLFPLAIGVLRDELPEHRLIPSLALVSALLSIGSQLGLVVTGVLARGGGDYRRIFWLSTVLTAVSLAMCLVVLPRRAAPVGVGGVDWWGGLLLGGALVLLLLPLSTGPDRGWLAPSTWGCLLGAVALGWLFVTVERRRRSPLISPALMAQRPVWVTNLVALMLGLAAFSSFLGVSQFVQSPRSGGYGFGASVLETSLVYLLPGGLVGILLAPLTGRIIQRHGGRTVLVTAAAVGTLSTLGIVLWHSGPAEVAVLNAVASVGNGLAFATIPSLVVRHVSRSETGVATGIASISRSVGSSVASALSATLIASLVVAGTGRTSGTAYVVIFLIGAVSFLVIAVAGLVGLPRHDRGGSAAALGHDPMIPAAPAATGGTDLPGRMPGEHSRRTTS